MYFLVQQPQGDCNEEYLLENIFQTSFSFGFHHTPFQHGRLSLSSVIKLLSWELTNKH